MSANHPDNSKSSPAPGDEPLSWGWADLIDFEFFLEQDRGRPLAELDARDRDLVRRVDGEANEATPSGPTTDRRDVFRRWLGHRRGAWGEGNPLPGDMAMEAWRMGQRILVIAGGILGAGAAVQLLRYDGVQPVNVAAYLGWLVLAQILLVLLAAGLFLLRQAGSVTREGAWLTGAVRWAWAGLALRLNRHGLDRISGESRMRVQSFCRGLAGKRSLYGGALLWPLAGAWQRFGVAFNAAALVATLALILFSDRAFGWQSAMPISTEQVSGLVAGLAAPWSWAIPAAAGPTWDQIEGSRIVLKDGIKQLATAHLVSWWPFLSMALLIYGLVPRLVLWAGMSIQSARVLRQLPFHHAVCDRLFARLTAGTMDTSGVGDQPERCALPAEDIAVASGDGVRSWAPVARGMAVVMVNDAMMGPLDTGALKRRIEARLGWGVASVVTWPWDDGERSRILGELGDVRWEDGRAKLVLLE
jgi:hypothetical protein